MVVYSFPGIGIFVENVLGGRTLNAAGDQVVAADAIRLMFAVDGKDGLRIPVASEPSSTVDAHDAALAWEKEFIDLLERRADNAPEGFRLAYFAERSRDDGLAESQEIDPALIITTLVLIICFSVAANTSVDVVETRTLVSLAGLLAALLSIAVGFGLAAGVVGMKYASINGFAPFLLLGVGVDNMFIFSSAAQRTPAEWPVHKRVSHTAKEAGLTVTITSATNVLAFGIGIASPFRAVSIFCVYTALSIFAGYVLMSTFLIACIVLDLRRESAGRSAFTCRVLPDKDEWEDDSDEGEEAVAPNLEEDNERLLRPQQVVPSVALMCPGAGFTAPRGRELSAVSEENDMRTTAVVPASSRRRRQSPRRPIEPMEIDSSRIKSPPARRDRVAKLGGNGFAGRELEINPLAQAEPSPTASDLGVTAVKGGLPGREEVAFHGYVGAMWDRLFARKVAPCIVFAATIVTVLVLYYGLLGVCGYGLTRLKQGLELQNLAPSDHYSNDFEDNRQEYFLTGMPFQIVIDGVLDYRSATVRGSVRRLSEEVVADGDSLEEALDSWLDSFEVFINTEFSGAPPVMLSPKQFREVLGGWLIDPSGVGRFGKDLALVDESGQQVGVAPAIQALLAETDVTIVGCQLPIRTKPLPRSLDRADSMVEARDACDRVRQSKGRELGIDFPNVFPWFDAFVIFEQYRIIVQSTAQSLAFAAVSMMVVASLLLPSMGLVATVLLALVGIDLLIVGGMWVLGISLDAISSINLVISIGFSVDFTAHVAHAYLHAKGTGFETNGHCCLPSLPNPYEDDEEESGGAGVGRAGSVVQVTNPVNSAASARNSPGDGDVSRELLAAQSNVSASGVDGCWMGPSRRARAVEALTFMGRPVFQGGLSTLLSLIPVAFIDSYIFDVFFAMLFMTILFGLFHGSVILPMYLRLWGPPRVSDDEPTLRQKRTGAPRRKATMARQMALPRQFLLPGTRVPTDWSRRRRQTTAVAQRPQRMHVLEKQRSQSVGVASASRAKMSPYV